MDALNEEEIARNELKATTTQYDAAVAKLNKFKQENEKAIQLNLELSNILGIISFKITLYGLKMNYFFVVNL